MPKDLFWIDHTGTGVALGHIMMSLHFNDKWICQFYNECLYRPWEEQIWEVEINRTLLYDAKFTTIIKYLINELEDETKFFCCILRKCQYTSKETVANFIEHLYNKGLKNEFN